MGEINIYKIQNNRFKSLKSFLNEEGYSNQGSLISEIEVLSKNTENPEIKQEKYKMSFFLKIDNSDKDLNWDWVFDLFNVEKFKYNSNPKAIILIKNEMYYYAITFGHSHHKPNLYCDRNWPFEYARRLKYKNIKSTSTTIPNSQRNQVTSGFRNYYSLDLDSGEGLNKLNAYAILEEKIDFIGENINIGNSLKFKIHNVDSEDIAKVIDHIEDTIDKKDPITKIPYLKEIKDDNIINKLNTEVSMKLFEDINSSKRDNFNIDLSTYLIHGTNTYFLNDNSEYLIKCQDKENSINFEKQINYINMDEIHEFMRELRLSNKNNVLKNVKVIIINEKQEKTVAKLSELIFYNTDDENYVLTNGAWHEYNTDYKTYLKKSLSEIDVKYNKELNYDENKYSDEKPGEFRFIKFLENEHDYINRHTENETIYKGHTVEAMDLYKENTMYTIKFGAKSSQLCYAIDQSYLAIKAIHSNELKFDEKITDVCLWLVLNERKTELPIKNGIPDINELKMFLLKNRIDFWKKEVRLLGYNPIIKINYNKNSLNSQL